MDELGDCLGSWQFGAGVADGAEDDKSRFTGLNMPQKGNLTSRIFTHLRSFYSVAKKERFTGKRSRGFRSALPQRHILFQIINPRG